MTNTETIRWTLEDGDNHCRELEARLTDDTPVTITANGETHIMTTVGIVGRYARLPFGRVFFLSGADEWSAEVPVEPEYPAWLDQAIEGDELNDDASHRWECTDYGRWWRELDGAVLSAADLHRKHGPLTPVRLAGKPAVAWAVADALALAVCRERRASIRPATDDELRALFGYGIAIAITRALCTIYDEPEENDR